MSTGDLNEEQLRALYEEQMRQIRVEDVLMNSVVELVNQGMRRTGLVEGGAAGGGGPEDRDADQVRLAIEAVRALLPLVESIAPQQMAPLRDALSQLQFAYVQIGGAAPVGGEAPAESAPGPEGTGGAPSPGPGGSGGPEPPASKPGDAGPAQRSGRLWVPGQ